MFDVRSLFTRAAIIKYLKALPRLKTPVMDTIFSNRPQHPLPVVGADMITPVVHELPVIKRGAPSIPATRETGSIGVYEPFPVRPNVFVTAADLNNLKLLGASGLDAWARERTDLLRRVIRKTCEAMCAVALTGRLQWPVKLEEGGFETYDVDFGNPLSVTPGKMWDASDAKLVHVFDTLTGMSEAIEEKGYGSSLEIWAGKSAYNALFAIAENSRTTAKIRVEITDQGINVGGYLVRRRAEKYRKPDTGEMIPVVDDKTVKMIAKDAGHFMPYCAIDDLDGNLQPLPMFVKPERKSDPSGYKLIGESKPFPVPNVAGICDAVVVS